MTLSYRARSRHLYDYDEEQRNLYDCENVKDSWNYNILITGISSKKYLIYNLETMKLTEVQDSYIDVSNIVILDKSQRL